MTLSTICLAILPIKKILSGGDYAPVNSCGCASRAPGDNGIFLLENLRDVGNGIEVAATRRAKLFVEHLQTVPRLITAMWDPELHVAVKALKARGALPEEVPVYNLYEAFSDELRSGEKLSRCLRLKVRLSSDRAIAPKARASVGKKITISYARRDSWWRIMSMAPAMFCCANISTKEKRICKLPVSMLPCLTATLNPSTSREAFFSWMLEMMLPDERRWHFIVDKKIKPGKRLSVLVRHSG